MRDFLTDKFDKDIRELRKAEKEEKKAERASEKLERQAAKVTGGQIEERVKKPRTSLKNSFSKLGKIEVGKNKKKKAKGRYLPDGLVPVLTSFDFLSGSFEKAKKTRIFNTSISGLVAAALIVVGAQTTMTKISADSDSRTIKQLKEEQSTLNTAVKSDPNAVQYPQAELNSFVAEHSAIIQDLLKEEPDVRILISDLRSLAPAGLEITGVFFTSPEQKPVKATDKDTDKDTKVEATDKKSAPVTLGAIQIVATATQYDLVAQWVKLISQMTYLKESKTTWAGVPGDASTVTITTKAILSTDIASERTKQVKDVDGIDKEGNFRPEVIPEFLRKVYSRVQEGRVVVNG